MQSSNPSTEQLIKNIVTLDVLSDLGDISRNLLPKEIKLLWNLSKRFRYEGSPLEFADDEKDYFMSVSNYKGFPVPQFVTTFLELTAPNYLETAYENSLFSDVGFEYYLMDYVIYGRKLLFPTSDFLPETWHWLLTKVDLVINETVIPLHKLALSFYYSSKDMRAQYALTTEKGCLGFLGFYCFFQAREVLGYRMPLWMKEFLNKPSKNFSPAFGLTLSICAEALYYSEKEFRERYDLSTLSGRLGFVGFFCLYRAPFIGDYNHPDWLQKLLDAPSENIPNAEKIGLTLLLEAIWYADPPLQNWLNIHSEAEQPELVQWFIWQKSKKIPRFKHPQWVVNLFGEQINVRDEKPSVSPPKTEQPSNTVTINFESSKIVFDKGGVNLIGWPRTAVGIGEDVRVAASAFNEINLPFVVLDGATRVPPRVPQQDLGLEKYIVEAPEYQTSIVFLDAATQFRYFCFDLLKNKKRNQKVIIACPWELPSWPRDMDFVFESADMFWAATRYIYDAFKPYFPEEKIYLAPSAVYIPPHKIEPFSLLAINEPFTFLTTFDGESSIHRKNPFAVVNAFQAAFPKENRDVRLIVKTMNLKNTNVELNNLVEKIKSDHRIELINQTLTTDELLALNKRSHCFVSLHRSEGFGRNIAENMLLGRPVICSAFSGNLDFCFADNSYLVEGKTIPVQPGQYAFSRNQHWFDASVEHAAVQMKAVFENRVQANTIANNGRDYIKSFHSIKETGLRYQQLLKDL